MNKIYILFGPGGVGKDAACNLLLKKYPEILDKFIIPIQTTTRKCRANEKDGVDKYFISKTEFENLIYSDKIIAREEYPVSDDPNDTVLYGFNKDNFDLENHNYFVKGVSFNVYKSFVDAFGTNVVVPIYVYTDTYTRLIRMLDRENVSDLPLNENTDRIIATICSRVLQDARQYVDKELLLYNVGTDDTIINSSNASLDKVVENIYTKYFA